MLARLPRGVHLKARPSRLFGLLLLLLFFFLPPAAFELLLLDVKQLRAQGELHSANQLPKDLFHELREARKGMHHCFARAVAQSWASRLTYLDFELKR